MYKIEEQEGDDPLFIFHTNTGLTYYVSFQKMELDSFYFHNLYSVDFGEINGSKKTKDKLTRLTIKQIISDFLQNNPSALLHYVCDSSDGRHFSRSRLFSSWFDIFKEDGHNKLIVNFKNEEIDYRLEFIFKDSEYNIDKLENQVAEQMEIFSTFK